MTPLKRGQIMSDDDFLAKTEEYGDDFRALMGAEAVRELLRTIDIDREVETLRGELKATSSEAKIKKISKRLKVLDCLLYTSTRGRSSRVTHSRRLASQYV